MRAVVLSTLAALLLLHAGCSKQRADQNANAPGEVSGDAAQHTSQPPQGGDARAHFERGMEAYRENRDAEAAEAFRQVLQLEPDFAEAHYRLGLALNAAGQSEESDKAFEEGAEAYEKLTKKEPKNSDAYYFLGLCYEKLGKYDEAVKALKESVRNSPEEDDDKYYELALAHFKIAQYDDSVRALNKALEINPDNYPAADLLEKARSGASRVEEFRKRQEQLRKQQSGNSNANANANGNSNRGANANSGAGANKNRAPSQAN